MYSFAVYDVNYLLGTMETITVYEKWSSTANKAKPRPTVQLEIDVFKKLEIFRLGADN